MKIGDLSRKTQTAVETIRFYERVGLLPRAHRSNSNYRIYEEAHVERLRFIRNCRLLDMTLDEVRALLATKDDPDCSCVDANALLDEHIKRVANRIADLKALERTLRALREQCGDSQPGSACGILTGLASSGIQRAVRTSHVARLSRIQALR